MRKIFAILIILLFNLISNAQNGAYLNIESEPTGATVKLNGVVKGSTPLEIIVLPGTYVMVVTKSIDENTENYYKESITIKNVEIKKISITLEKQLTESYKKKIALLISTKTYGSFTDDRDSKIYKTVKIGTQTWMAENLAYKANSECWAYNNDKSNVATFGYLYSWNSAKSSCPTGWHLPSKVEWSILLTNLGSDLAGGRLKETGMTHWQSPNKGATNEAGFTALPGGSRYNDNRAFEGKGTDLYWWSSTEEGSNKAWYISTYNTTDYIGWSYFWKSSGMSCRCIKD